MNTKDYLDALVTQLSETLKDTSQFERLVQHHVGVFPKVDIPSVVPRRAATILILESDEINIADQRRIFDRLDESPESVAVVLLEIAWHKSGCRRSLLGKKLIDANLVAGDFCLFLHLLALPASLSTRMMCPVSLATIQISIQRVEEFEDAGSKPAPSKRNLN